MEEEIKTKVCSHCKKELLLTEFSKNKNAKDGLHSACKKCERERLINKHPEANYTKNANSDPNIRICKKCKKERPIEEFEIYKSGNRFKRRLICNECLIEIKNKETKVCVICGVEKSKSLFGKDPQKPDGLDSRCKECVVDYKKTYYEENKEFVLLSVKIYRENNKEIVGERKKLYNSKNRKYVLQWHRKYYWENKDYLNERGRNYYIEHEDEYKARVKEYSKTPAGRASSSRSFHKRRLYGELVENTLTDKQWDIILYDQQHNLCAECRKEFNEKRRPTKDHIRPLSSIWRMGLTFGNTRALCQSCNSKKHDHMYFMRGVYELLVKNI